jgi:hypothetical protein
MKARVLIAIVALFFGVASSAVAATPKAFECEFQNGVFTVFENGRPKSESGAAMRLIFGSVDIQAGTAQLIGNAGAVDVFLLSGTFGLNFVEMTPVGNVNLTTVYYGTLPDGRFKAVTSRHVGISEDPMMSQYWGACEGKW